MKKLALALTLLVSACVGPADNAAGPAPDAGADDFVGGKGGETVDHILAPDAGPDASADFLDPKGRGVCTGCF